MRRFSDLIHRRVHFGILLLSVVFVAALTGAAGAAPPDAQAIQGNVATAGNASVGGYDVSLYARFVDQGPSWRLLGSDRSDNAGRFRIDYSLPPGLAKKDPVLFVYAARGQAMLVAAIGNAANAPTDVVVNERTTVAMANAYAQFVDDRSVSGNAVGVANGARMAANLANPRTGATGIILGSVPNGTKTSTLSTFNSLANVVAACVATSANCGRLFDAATPPGGARPTNVVQALANIVKSPSYPGYPNASDPIFVLSQAMPVYQPALAQRPTSWLLFLKFTGGFYYEQNADNLMNGPGNFAIDAAGFAWVNDNYVPQPVDHFACAGRRLMKFYPWGENVPESPYFGGGLAGAGYGITLDPTGNVWVGNFGFQDPPCELLPDAATHDSVSAFRPDGIPISPPRGFTQGDISWPQATISDRKGNIWLANCGNDSVTMIPRGDHSRAFNIPLGPPPPRPREPQIKPFGAAVDLDGNVWITGTRSDTVSVVSPQGHLIDTLPASYQGRTVLTHPIGNAADSKGNIWVANSDWLDTPCPTRFMLGSATNPSITLYDMKTRKPHPRAPFIGGGITLPWGIAVDGSDTVWVFNFGAAKVGTDTDTPTGISRFCGTNTKRCPPGMQTGDPISPATGYQSDALERITGGQIDASGNVWLTNNWKRDADPLKNPAGNAIVIAIGAASPIKTPLIGPPVPAD